MSNIACITIPLDVGGPFEFCGVGVAGADVAGLELLELLLRAKFVCLEVLVSMAVWKGRGIGRDVPFWVESWGRKRME